MRCGDRPYTSALDDITAVSIVPGGDVIVCNHTIGNIYTQDIEEIIAGYDPYKHPIMKILLDGGMKEMKDYAKGIGVDTSECYSICDVCHLVAK